jgi:hypothetical protein
MPRVQKIFQFTGEVNDAVNALRHAEHLPANVKTFFLTLTTMAQGRADRAVRRQELQAQLKQMGQPASDWVIKARVDELIEAGGGDEQNGVYEDKSACFIKVKNLDLLNTLYLRRSIESLDREEYSPRGVGVYNQQLSLFAAQSAFLQSSRSSVGYAEGLMQIVDASMPLDTKDRRREINVSYPIGNPGRREIVSVTARTLRNPDSPRKDGKEVRGGIMVQTDKRAVNTLALLIIEEAQNEGVDFEALQRGEASDSEFKRAYDLMSREHKFDIYSIAEEMGFSMSGGGGASEAREIISRVRETVFDIEFGRAPMTRDRFNYLFDDDGSLVAQQTSSRSGMLEFRFFTTFRLIDDLDRDPKNPDKVIYAPRWYAVRLHPEYIVSLLRGRFVVHKGLNKERNATAHKLATWCKSIIGVRAGGHAKDTPRSFRVDELWERTIPGCTLGNYERSLKSLLKRECISPHGWDPKVKCLSKAYGYYFEWDPSIERSVALRKKRNMLKYKGRKEYAVITIWRDPDDVISGNNSLHNKKLRAEENELRRARALFDQVHSDKP